MSQVFDDLAGGRERKLVHAMAERRGLSHWSENVRVGDVAKRVVVVANYLVTVSGKGNGRGGGKRYTDEAGQL